MPAGYGHTREAAENVLEALGMRPKASGVERVYLF